MRGFRTNSRKVLSAILAAAMVAGMMPQLPAAEVHAAEKGALTSVESAAADKNIVMVTFNDGIQAKITFLEGDIFRYNVDPEGKFSEYATTVYGNDTVRIPQYPDDYDEYSHPDAAVSEEDGYYVITAGDTTIKFEKATAKMTVAYKDKVVMEESKALKLGEETVQSLVKNDDENFYGGGTQNGRFVHTGESISIKNQSTWTDGGVASPNPFYYSSEGYGVLRNTFLPGTYDFGKTDEDTVTTVHEEEEFDAYYFLSDGENATEVVQDVLNGYYHVTGNPTLLPEYAFYEGHLNAYNRDSWTESDGTRGWTIFGSNSSSGSEGYLTSRKEAGQASGYKFPENSHAESLNGYGPSVSTENYPDSVDTPYEYSARAVIDQYVDLDMPLGYFLPNDGYGAGYGQNGYYVKGDVNSDECVAVIDANVDNLKDFTEYARENGVEVGLWTQSYLTPQENKNEYWHLLRDFNKEVNVGGVTTLKTDVAWVGYGYDMALNAQQTGYNTVTTGVNYRPNIISLDGWAGTQRFAGIWTGDQYGGNWEYIRFHIPTYIGQSLSGNPNIGSDMDGIFGGSTLITTRDTQWKVFTPTMLNMDGWGSYAKTPYTAGDPYTGINRMYLKLKAQLLPYIYTSAASASNIDTGNDDAGLPMIRAMFLEYPDDTYASTKAMQYQYMFGKNILVAPVYTETENIDEQGNDVRNGIYLPDEDQIWIDYFTGDQYYGGQVLNNFDAPIWKLPVFVKNGAIIPMWEENNNPASIDKANRITEFWPDGSTEYTLYEDNGTYVENEQTKVEGYGTVNDISYGDHVSTRYTSVVENGTATLTAEKSTGSYEGYDKDKNTTFIVNVSKEPTAVTAKNGNTVLKKVEKNSKDEVLNAELKAGEFAYYYDESPAIETYAVDGEDEFAAMMDGKVSSPKLYVKFAETDSQANAQVLTLEGFENVDTDLPVNKVDESLAVPADLHDVEEAKTPSSNTIAWEAVEGATSYEVRVDGVINNVGNTTTYVHDDQDYYSLHTYEVRARGENGYSEWSEVLEARTALDPWRNVPNADITWTGGDSWGALSNATDHDTSTMFHSTGDVVTDAVPMIFDFGDAYTLDKFEYYARDNYGNGTVKRMNIYVSLDGVNWKTVYEADEDWTYDSSASVVENVQTVSLEGNAARYVKLVVTKSVGNFFCANELAIYKTDGSSAFAVGSTNNLPEVGDGDYTNMKNYLGMSEEDGSKFVDQIQKRHGDINYNGVYDVYDYAYTMFKLDGGTTKTGSVSGNVKYELVETEDDTIVINVMADGVKNLNAFGQVLRYDPAKLTFVSVEAGSMVGSMEDLSVNKVYEDGSAYVNLAFANRGDQEVVKGTGILATITMKGESVDDIDLSSIMIIGPDFSYERIQTAAAPGPKDPTLKEGNLVTFNGNTDVTMTMTNEYLKTDDGSNINTLIQQGSYAGLFDGSMGRDFEFVWDIESNYVDGALPKEITLPLTLHFTLNEAAPLNQISIYNANKANGYVIKAEAVLNYSDGTTSEKQTIEITNMIDYAPFDFVWADSHKEVASADVTLLEAINSSGEAVTNMITLAEAELRYNDLTVVTGISAEGNATKIEVGDNVDITATFTPENATNKYFTATSSDPSVAEIVTVADAKGYKAYQVRGVEKGTAEITLTALENPKIKTTYTVTVEKTDPADDSRDIPVEVITPTAASEDGGTAGNQYGPVEYALDGNEKTAWMTDWNSYATTIAEGKGWIDFEFSTPYTVDGLRYLPCDVAVGGTFTSTTAYEIYVKTADSDDYELITTGEWENTTGWKIAKFDAVENVTNVKFLTTEAATTNWWAIAAEIRVTGTEYEGSSTTVDKTYLAYLIEFAESLNATDYVDFTEVETALAAAKAVYENENATAKNVKDASENLKKAIENLEDYSMIPEAKAELATVIDYALSLNAADYVDFTEVEAAIAAAKAVYADANATLNDVLDVYDALVDAIDALEEKTETPVEENGVVRLYGADRYATGIAAADELKEVLGVEKFDTVVIATGKGYADALSGSYLAAVKNAPILLTSGKTANIAELHAYIKENVTAGGKVYILGGESAVPEAVEAIEGYDVVRLKGGNRYETNLAILAEAGVEGQEDLLVATGKDFADSLSASAASRPILLVKPNTALTDDQKAVAANFANIYVIGGEGAVSASVANELKAYGTVTRLSGASRYETSVAVAEAFFTDPETVVLAYGKKFPDGLCGGALAAALNAPLILTKEGSEDAAAAYVAANGIASGYVLGGESVLPNDTVVTVFGLDSAADIK